MIANRTRRNLRRQLRQSVLAKLGVGFLLVLVIAAVFAPVLAPYNPTVQQLDQRNLPPVGFTKAEQSISVSDDTGEAQSSQEIEYVEGSWTHPLGTDPLGRDILSRLIYGARVSLLVGVVGSGLGAMAGVIIGLFSGYYGGRVDDLLMRSVDVALAIPGLVLALTLIGITGPVAVKVPDPFVSLGMAPEMPPTFTIPGAVTLAIAIVSWEEFARLARGEGLSIRETNYIKAAKSIGVGDVSIVWGHMIPNAFTPVLVFWTLRIGRAILIAATLSFLGFSGTTLSWGYDISVGRQYLATAWWVSTMPGMAIMMAVIGVNLVGDWLRDALDPNLDEGIS